MWFSFKSVLVVVKNPVQFPHGLFFILRLSESVLFLFSVPSDGSRPLQIWCHKKKAEGEFFVMS